MTYTITLADVVVCTTDFPPLAQAAWNRAARDRDGAHRGWTATIEKDGVVLAATVCRIGHKVPWPDPTEAVADWRSVYKTLLLLLRDDSWDVKQIAEAMTNFGLPTTRARLDALRGSTHGKCAEVEPAELVVLLYAVLSEYKQRSV